MDDVEMSVNSMMEEDVNDDESETYGAASKEKLDSAELEKDAEEEPTVKLTNLPIARVRKIVKTDPEVSLVNQEAIFLITKATELFLSSLSSESYKYTQQAKKKTIQKKDVLSAINNVDALLFLDGIF